VPRCFSGVAAIKCEAATGALRSFASLSRPRVEEAPTLEKMEP